MVMKLPDSLREPLSWTGMQWPQADELEVGEKAEIFRQFADDLNQLVKDLEAAENGICKVDDGPAMAAFEQWWNDNDRPPALLRDDAKAADIMAAVFAQFAAITLALKLYFVLRLVSLKTRVEFLEKFPAFLAGWLIRLEKTWAKRALEDQSRNVVDAVNASLAKALEGAERLMRVLGPYVKLLEDAQRAREMAEIRADLASINPHFGDPSGRFDVNCVHCAIAYDLRRRGLDLEATQLPERFGNGGRSTNDAVQELYGRDMQDGNREEIERAFREAGPGARGIIRISWDNGGGHAFNVENINGQVVFLDAQGNHVDVGDYFDRGHDTAYVRTDDVESPGTGDSDEFAR